MKCFIHQQKEAVGTCKKCGKAMCVDCSAYSAHTGICPECRRDEYVRERQQCESELHELNHRIGWMIALAVAILIVAIVAGALLNIKALVVLIAELVPIIVICVTAVKKRPIIERVDWLTSEINKLNKHLKVGRAVLDA